ncbi:MAG: hypothetical protein P4L43_01460 [Syntrophobacteraceae bacterium]|nr:hypothetical protein [Syntrophobacteraceae bacterium]
MIKKCAFVFVAFLLLTGCASQDADQSQNTWQKPQGVSEGNFQRDVAACRSVAIATVPKGYEPFQDKGDPEQEWARLQEDPMSYRALLKYENCMQGKGYVLEDHDWHLSDLKIKTE